MRVSVINQWISLSLSEISKHCHLWLISNNGKRKGQTTFKSWSLTANTQCKIRVNNKYAIRVSVTSFGSDRSPRNAKMRLFVRSFVRSFFRFKFVQNSQFAFSNLNLKAISHLWAFHLESHPSELKILCLVLKREKTIFSYIYIQTLSQLFLSIT